MGRSSTGGLRAALPGVALCVLAAAPAGAAPRKAACFTSATASVAFRERVGEVGDDIAVRLPRPGQPAPAGCTYKPGPTDWIVGGRRDAFHPLALQGRFLAIDVGTGGPRNLVIYDVTTRRPVVTTRYDGEPGRFRPAPDAISFWAVSPDRIDSAACSAAFRASPDGRGVPQAHRTTEMRLSIPDGALKPTGDTGCTPVTEDE